jgi:hypothetical protein
MGIMALVLGAQSKENQRFYITEADISVNGGGAGQSASGVSKGFSQ